MRRPNCSSCSRGFGSWTSRSGLDEKLEGLEVLQRPDKLDRDTKVDKRADRAET